MVVRNDYRDKEERYQLILDLKRSRLKSSGKQPCRGHTQFWREKVYKFLFTFGIVGGCNDGDSTL